MSRTWRIFALVCLPALTLLLGWQLGRQYELLHLDQQVQMIEAISNPKNSTGVVLGDPEKKVDLALLWQVWRLLQQKYIYPQDLKTQALVMGAVQGMVDAVGDPYTYFMTPQVNEDFHDALAGDLQGIGAELGLRNGAIVVISPLKGSPAEGAGLLPGDRIIAVDAVSVAGMDLGSVVGKIRGEEGTSVTITIVRGNTVEPLSFTIERKAIHVPSVTVKERPSGLGMIGVLTLNEFGETAVEEMRDALTMLKEKEAKAIILDLRYNGGGFLEGAVDIVSMFVAEGNVVSVQHRDGVLEKHFIKGGQAITLAIPMVVLVNEGTASAAEITAGALQDYDRAQVIGMKTFGKGTVQEVVELPGGGSLRVTVAHWLTPNGRDIAMEGVEPDMVVERTLADLNADRDPQMDAAVQWIEHPTPKPALPLESYSDEETGSGKTAD